jgi:glycolate oxidase FAD binding subunit
MPVGGEWIYEWGGALRWFVSTAPCNGSDMGAIAKQMGGHAYCVRSAVAVAHHAADSLDANLLGLQQQIKKAFDPHGLLNAGRQYLEI